MYGVSLVAQTVKNLPEMKKMFGSKMKRAGERSLDATGRIQVKDDGGMNEIYECKMSNRG